MNIIYFKTWFKNNIQYILWIYVSFYVSSEGQIITTTKIPSGRPNFMRKTVFSQRLFSSAGSPEFYEQQLFPAELLWYFMIL